jgi:hypothetical protein
MQHYSMAGLPVNTVVDARFQDGYAFHAKMMLPECIKTDGNLAKQTPIIRVNNSKMTKSINKISMRCAAVAHFKCLNHNGPAYEP